MLKVEADAQDGGGPVVGEVEFLDNRIDPATGTIALRAIFANQDQRLHPGQFLRLDRLLGELTDVPVIPVRAVQAGQRGDQVYLVSPDRRAELRPVTLGPRVGDEVAVSAGLEGGEQLVIDGQARLAKGVKLDLKEADPAAGQ
jgi:multidrug efflux system membrane fusion protein